MKTRKKLIEVALPLDAINKASAREKSIRHGHPSTLHLWWARRPLAAARAVIFAQMVDDPSAVPEEFGGHAAQAAERQRLFRILEELVIWENTTNETVLERARAEIRRSWRRACKDNRDHPQADELFNPDKLPAFHDPFAGGGALPLEAQRLGLEAHASDLNPVAVLINKAMIEIPPKFAGRPPVNPESRRSAEADGALGIERQWHGAQGLAEDVRYYGKWMRDEAERRIGHLYPKVKVTSNVVAERPDLKTCEGRELTVIAWLWVRTVRSPNPAFANVDVPLATSFVLSSKKGREVWIEPVIDGQSYRFEVRVGTPPDQAKTGTSAGKRSAFRCLMSGVPITYPYIRELAQKAGLGARLMAVVAESERSRVYLSHDEQHERAAQSISVSWRPDQPLPNNPRDFKTPNYGMPTFAHLFTDRQLLALTTFSNLVAEMQNEIEKDAFGAGTTVQGQKLAKRGTNARAYAEAVRLYLAFAVSKVANTSSTITSWMSDRGAFRETFARQAIPMIWDYAEANPLQERGGGISKALDKAAMVLAKLPLTLGGHASQADAHTQVLSQSAVVSTDPPYYDNICYADLSDFFYVWLRRGLKAVFPDIFTTLAVPKAEELVAAHHRHKGRDIAEKFFLHGMTEAIRRLVQQVHSNFPTTIYYAFKQSEKKGETGKRSTGWETFLDAVIRSGFMVMGTWPVRTEGPGRLIGIGKNALASSIVLVCRQRPEDAPLATRRKFIAALRAELPAALTQLQNGNIAPVDLAQAAIGPGMAVYTRYARVIDAQGNPVTVRDALAFINQILDETLAKQEGDFDADTRWALGWFEQHGFAEGDFGVAETLSTAKNTSVHGLEQAGILASKSGTVRLLPPDALPEDWNPTNDARLTVWEAVHHLVRALQTGGETAAAALVTQLGGIADTARELTYRLYTIAERQKRTDEAFSYNALVQSWPEIVRLAQSAKPHQQADLL
ncbi:MAG: DUF1156 domain-containing protein [Gammaproteobacteria bacterium]|nr:DUF1156 domain-containing protein [Gammaproteobacteria bacterium]